MALEDNGHEAAASSMAVGQRHDRHGDLQKSALPADVADPLKKELGDQCPVHG